MAIFNYDKREEIITIIGKKINANIVSVAGRNQKGKKKSQFCPYNLS